MTSRPILLASVVASSLYLVTPPYGAADWRVFLKVASIALLAALGFRVSNLLGAALSFGALGDFLLGVRRLGSLNAEKPGAPFKRSLSGVFLLRAGQAVSPQNGLSRRGRQIERNEVRLRIQIILPRLINHANLPEFHPVASGTTQYTLRSSSDDRCAPFFTQIANCGSARFMYLTLRLSSIPTDS
jgi:hypothetical protein